MPWTAARTALATTTSNPFAAPASFAVSTEICTIATIVTIARATCSVFGVSASAAITSSTFSITCVTYATSASATTTFSIAATTFTTCSSSAALLTRNYLTKSTAGEVPAQPHGYRQRARLRRGLAAPPQQVQRGALRVVGPSAH